MYYQKTVQTLKQDSKFATSDKNLSSESTQTGKQTLSIQQEADEHMVKLDNTCYVYIDPTKKHQLKASLHGLLEEVNVTDKNLIIASSEGSDRLTNIVEQCLQEEEQMYTKDVLNMPYLNQAITSNLGKGISLIAALASTNPIVGDENYDEEEKRKPFLKRRI